MLIKHKEILGRAKAAGYEDVNDYGCDHDLARCETCGLWGRYGEEVYENATETYCDEHRPVEVEAK